MCPAFPLERIEPQQKIFVFPAPLDKSLFRAAFQQLGIGPNRFSAQSLQNIVLLIFGQDVALALQLCQNAILDWLLARFARTE